MNRLAETMTRLVRNSGERIANQQQGQEVLQPPNLTQMEAQVHGPTPAHQGIPPIVGHEAEVPKSPAPKESIESLAIVRLEERLKAVDKTEAYDLISPNELCLVPGIVFPPKLKMPEFEKFNGTQSPKFHCTKMAAHVGNDKLWYTVSKRV